MSALLTAGIGAAGTVIVAAFCWLGVRATSRTASLEKATAAWETLYATQEKRLSSLEARLGRLEQANDSLGQENRVFREVVAGILARLQRDPPDTPDSVVAYILEHIPAFRKADTE